MEIHENKRLREIKIHKTTQRQNRRITDRAGKETIDVRKPNENFFEPRENCKFNQLIGFQTLS